MESFFNTKSNKVLGSLLILMLIIALGAYAKLTFKESNYINSGPATISVSGNGEVTAVPDIGEFSFSVTAEGEEASAAQEASGEKINSVLMALKDAGVEEKDIKTQNYNMYPRYEYEQEVCPVGAFCPPGERVQVGFEVSQTVKVKVRDLDSAGRLISTAGELGATNISSLQFTIDDTDVLKEEARALAIEDAKEKALKLAGDLDVSLVRMVGYHENEGYLPAPYAYGLGGDEAMERAVASFDAPDLPAGENTIASQVSITYQVE